MKTQIILPQKFLPTYGIYKTNLHIVADSIGKR